MLFSESDGHMVQFDHYIGHFAEFGGDLLVDRFSTRCERVGDRVELVTH